MGTALGDFTATTLHLGYLASGALFAAVIAIPAIGYRLLRWDAVFSFWFAYVATRPLGASFADYLGKPKSAGGLGLGDGPVTLVLALAIFCLVAFLAVTHRDVQGATVPGAHGRGACGSPERASPPWAPRRAPTRAPTRRSTRILLLTATPARIRAPPSGLAPARIRAPPSGLAPARIRAPPAGTTRASARAPPPTGTAGRTVRRRTTPARAPTTRRGSRAARAPGCPCIGIPVPVGRDPAGR